MAQGPLRQPQLDASASTSTATSASCGAARAPPPSPRPDSTAASSRSSRSRRRCCATSCSAAELAAGSRSGPSSTGTRTGQFVMWPYGYTKEDVPPTMTVDDHEAFVALATAHGRPQRLQGAPGERLLHLLGRLPGVGVWRPAHLRVHLRDVPAIAAATAAAASTRPIPSSSARRRATQRRSSTCSSRRTARTGRPVWRRRTAVRSTRTSRSPMAGR